MELSIELRQIVGFDQGNLCKLEQGQKTFLLHKQAREPFLKLRHEAKLAGFDMEIVSGYRDFSRQLSIWNAKVRGEKAVLDAQGCRLDLSCMTDRERLYAILRWSAIPGTSRHHWGSDIDIYDARQIRCEDVQLVPQEVEAGGACAAMHEWLSERIAQNQSCGFFRPYAIDTGGVAPELWHLSYLPVARHSLRQITPDIMLELWRDKGVLLLDQIEANITDIWNTYIAVSLQNQPEWVVTEWLLA